MNNHIIIPYFNQISELNQLLDTIKSEIRVSFKVIIVDNSTKNLLPDNYRKCKVLRAHSKIGYGRAVNLGLFEALRDHSEKIIVLNQDAIATPETLNALFINLHKIGPKSILLPLVKGMDDGLIPNHYLEFFETQGYSESNLHNSDTLLEITTGEIGFPTFAIHSNFIKTIGVFDPIFFMYCEDLDLIRRIRENGGKVYFLSNCFVRHRKSIFDFQTKFEVKRRNMWNQHSKFILHLKDKKNSLSYKDLLIHFNRYFDLWNLSQIKGNLYQSYLLCKNLNHLKSQLRKGVSLSDRITDFIKKDMRREDIDN